MRTSKSGFTLVELLVVIAIIGILVALLLPAIQMAREAGRRSSCNNNLKQIGLALQNYHDIHGQLPFGKGASYAGAAGYARWSAHSQILPFLEQKPLFDSIDFNKAPSTPGMGGVINFMPAFNSGVNDIPSQTRIAGFTCPSDISVSGDWRGQNNYAGNQGGFLCDRGDNNAGPGDINPSEGNQGMLYYLSQVRFAHVIDGTSHTMIFSEHLRGKGFPSARPDLYVITNQNSLDATYTTCNAINPQTATPLTSKWGFSWVMGENCCTLYNHVAPPNTTSCAGIPFPGGNMTNMAMQVPPSSYHPSGVNACMADGSIQFIPNSINLAVWRALGTRDGGEPTPQF
jgi:prepilin-type N-terminal cleavage/methylation domain-containing protein/prepilin-type processing-associated H-X9-DG protein